MKPPGSDIWGWLPASLLLHLLAAAVVLGGAATQRPARFPPVIDLSLLPPAGTVETAADRPSAGRDRARGPDRSAARPVGTLEFPAPAAPAAGSVAPPDFRTPGVPEETAPGIVPAASSPPASPPGNGPGILSDSSPTAPGGAPTVPGTLSGTFEPGESYGYLREAIQREIAYPAVARKMGWEGSVVVGFTILRDGTVRDVRLVRGSGFSILDRNALEAVRSASPFPRPPAAAKVLTPVLYKLDETTR